MKMSLGNPGLNKLKDFQLKEQNLIKNILKNLIILKQAC